MTQTIVHVPASEGGGSFDPTDITIADNTSPAFLVQDSSTEYIRIDTTTGNSQIQIDTGIVNQALSIKESREIQLRCGANNQFLLSGDNTIDAYAHTFNHRQFSGGKFRSLDAGGSEILRIDEDSDTTFTLNDTNNAVFKVQDNAGTPNNLLKIDTTGTADLEANCGTFDFRDHNGDQVMKYDASNSFRFGTNSGGGVGAFVGQGDELVVQCLRSGGAKIINKMRARGGGHGDKFRVNSDSVTNFEVDQDSGATFTLDDTSGAVFKVVDDNSSPRTYLSITEASNVQLGTTAGTTTFDGSGITVRSGSISFRNASSSSLAQYDQDYVISNAGGAFKGRSIYGTPVTTTSTGTVTVADQLLKQGRVFFYNSSGSGTATITVQYKTDGSFYEDGTSFAERFVTIHNKDSTHNVTYKFEPVTNEGTNFAALGSTDAVADDLLDGTGVALTPGQSAIFKVITYAINSTHSNHKHYWTTIAKG